MDFFRTCLELKGVFLSRIGVLKYHQSVKEIYFLADHVTYGNTQVARFELFVYNLIVHF